MKESRQPLMWQVYGSTAPSDPVERQAAFHVIKRCPLVHALPCPHSGPPCSFESNWTAPPHLSPIVRCLAAPWMEFPLCAPDLRTISTPSSVHAQAVPPRLP